MPTGFEAYDVNGKLQFNDSMFCYFLRKSVSGTTVSTKIGNTDPSSFTIPESTYLNPLIAVQCTSQVAFIGKWSGSYKFSCQGAAGTAFKYYIFDRSNAIPNSAFGIEVYDSTGAITFSSNYRPMQVLTILAYPGYDSYASPPASGQTVTYTGKSLACAHVSAAGHSYYSDPTYWLGGQQVIPDPDYDATSYEIDGKRYGAAVSNSNQTVTTGYVSFDDVTIGGPYLGIQDTTGWGWQTPLVTFVVDVTGVPDNTTFF